MSFVLRDYQVDNLHQIERLAHLLVPLPTGGGKMVVAVVIITKAVNRGERVLFVVHRRELVSQASAKLLANRVDHAVLMGSESSAYLGQLTQLPIQRAPAPVGAVGRLRPSAHEAAILRRAGRGFIMVTQLEGKTAFVFEDGTPVRDERTNQPFREKDFARLP